MSWNVWETLLLCPTQLFLWVCRTWVPFSLQIPLDLSVHSCLTLFSSPNIPRLEKLSSPPLPEVTCASFSFFVVLSFLTRVICFYNWILSIDSGWSVSTDFSLGSWSVYITKYLLNWWINRHAQVKLGLHMSKLQVRCMRGKILFWKEYSVFLSSQKPRHNWSHVAVVSLLFLQTARVEAVLLALGCETSQGQFADSALHKTLVFV